MVGSVPTTFRVLGEMVSGAYSVVEQAVAPGRLLWPHVHSDHDQVAIVLAGALGVRVGDREWTALPHEIVYRPRGVPHAVWNTGSTPTQFLEITSPASFEDYFLELADLSAPGQAEHRARLMAAYGVSGVDGWDGDLARKYGVRL